MAFEIVYDSEQLRLAVEDANVDTIFFGDNIELIDAIDIPPGKEELTFNGTYNGVTYTLTDMDSDRFEDTLAVRSSSSIKLTFRDMNIIGRNFCGIPCIFELLTGGVSVTYINVSYTGPQLVFNPMGLTHFVDCDISILPSGNSPAHETGEVSRVDFAGENTINHSALADSSKAVFWFRGTESPYFRVLEGAKLTINTTNYLMYNDLAYVSYEVRENASFTLISRQGISYNTIQFASSFLVDSGASFRYIQLEPKSGVASLYLSDGFTVNDGASVYMQADFDWSMPLIHFPTGLSSNRIDISNPKSFVMYNRGSAPISTALVAARNYSIITEQLNYWTTARDFPEAGTFDDEPQIKWNNEDWGVFTVSGRLSSLSTTASAEGLVDPPIPINNFIFQNAKVISAGSMLINPDKVVDNGREITGLTEPNAKLIISYTVDGVPYVHEDITAGADGRFECDPEMSIPIGTVVNIKANTPFLIKDVDTTVVWAGELTIASAPTKIEFKPPPVSTSPLLLGRLNPETPVIVRDSRQYLSQWTLSAAISGPLETAGGDVLENAVVFSDNDAALRELSVTPIIVRTEEPSFGDTPVYWPADKGILLRPTQPIRSGVKYTTQLQWTLEASEE